MATLNIQINTPEGVTLNTKGVYCDDNITVTPKLQTAIVMPASEEVVIAPSAGYAGIGTVVVKPTGAINADGIAEVSTEEAMDFVLTNGTAGQMYKYTGPDGKYATNGLYFLEVKA